MSSRNCRNYNFVIKDTLRQIGLAHFADTNYAINLRTFSIDVHEKLMNMHILEWQTQITENLVVPEMGAINYEHTNCLKPII